MRPSLLLLTLLPAGGVRGFLPRRQRVLAPA
jgi:hypothetical protein